MKNRVLKKKNFFIFAWSRVGNSYGSKQGSKKSWSLRKLNREKKDRKVYYLNSNIIYYDLVQKKTVSYLDILASRLSPFFKIAAFELEIEVVPHISGHYDIGKSKLFSQADVLEEQWIFVAYVAQLAVQEPERHHYSIVWLARQWGALLAFNQKLMQLVKLFLICLVHL